MRRSPARSRALDDVRWTRDLGGGALLDLGCYCISAARLVTGSEPDRVHGEAQMQGEVDGSFAGMLHFADVTATFQCSLLASLVNTIDVIGADGSLAFRTRSWTHPASSC